jgi:hypothetical protein
MMKNRDIPDHIVWSEEKGYYSKELTYGSNISAPAIKLDDVKGWRAREASSANKYFNAKFEELKGEMEKLFTEYNWNDFIFKQVEYSFQPIVGEIYFVYSRENNTYFLSLIEPDFFKKNNFLSRTRLESNGKWVKIY